MWFCRPPRKDSPFELVQCLAPARLFPGSFPSNSALMKGSERRTTHLPSLRLSFLNADPSCALAKEFSPEVPGFHGTCREWLSVPRLLGMLLDIEKSPEIEGAYPGRSFTGGFIYLSYLRPVWVLQEFAQIPGLHVLCRQLRWNTMASASFVARSA